MFNENREYPAGLYAWICYILCFWAKTLYYPYGFFGLVWFSSYMY